MCDYSLYTVPNRLAEEGDQLVLHRFETGTLGFASVCDIERDALRKQENRGWWAELKDWMLFRRPPKLPAVCIPPGARLLLTDVPRRVQESLCVGESEVAVFTEISNRIYSYRDALILPNKTQVLLQDLAEGIHATVLSLSSDGVKEPTYEEMHVGSGRF